MPTDSILLTRKLTRANNQACVFRDCDKTKIGVAGVVVDAQSERLTIAVKASLSIGECVQVDCENQLMRFRKRVEGTVISVQPHAELEGLFVTELEPRLRLNPAETRMLRPKKPIA